MNKYDCENLTQIISKSKNFKEVLIFLGLRAAGGNYKVIRNYIEKYKISISHFETANERASRSIGNLKQRNAKPLVEILVDNSPYSRFTLKKRLYQENLKQRKCELCGQGEDWNGKKMSLILDHINGKWNDNRLENLRIVCPNCNATLETHCRGNKEKKIKTPKPKGGLRLNARKIKDRPSLETLLEQVKELGYTGTGRLYDVSDNAIRLWIKAYLKIHQG